MKADADAADKLLVEGVEALEKYLDDHEVASAKLKQGFLMLTKAKLRLPEHALTEISYHEEFEASRVATLDSEGNWRLQDAPETKAQAKSGGDSLRHRRAGTVEELRSSNAGGSTSTLLWFSSLPPSDLRQAQKQFSNGLQALLVTAASVHKVQRAVHNVTSEAEE
ncbi:hypothetical protein PC129_g1340 [Phytophthora cactorum]|uniref:Vacuolar ATPase assembly protein VMA22 n=1 Tax=Phytophthora cactorum TaxID=29920 RepID=A0A329STJ6_9STRA|nr:hypothetical protein Pcac1_g16197 [Phytophthora cactorum]KAG2844832.1 hypothetical protein PC111_g1824 [Phytophthora cactorum]KAG2848280.1 hypothetical protein PC112_g762 [Phytophthora cactorum]KAG2868555.1 hypothetical protein PC113_g950 [Phytophthora cactorum]KAG2935222.1 hypothetical protein PC114_g710 [Phytophthora cactorum]